MASDERPIFLVGFMGSGKSTVGQLLAGRLGWSFKDTDRLAEESWGKTVEQIFRDDGEGRFRRLEWEALQTLGGLRRAVVATGGGLFAGAVQRRWIKCAGRTVWLDLPLADCRRRVGKATGRPLWAHGAVAGRAMFERRRAVYALADIRVDARGASPEEIVERLVRRL